MMKSAVAGVLLAAMVTTVAVPRIAKTNDGDAALYRNRFDLSVAMVSTGLASDQQTGELTLKAQDGGRYARTGEFVS